MRFPLAIIGMAFVLLLGWVSWERGYFGKTAKETRPVPIQGTSNNMSMQITSSVFEHNGEIPEKYTCDGSNVNPPLTISDVPKGTKSLVLIMDDPDVPKNIRPDGMWVHWVVWNIDPMTASIGENSVPKGAVEGKTTSGIAGYGGPCPPDREHRYFFKLYALDTQLSLPTSAEKAKVEEVMEGHILEKAELIGRYDRQSR